MDYDDVLTRESDILNNYGNHTTKSIESAIELSLKRKQVDQLRKEIDEIKFKYNEMTIYAEQLKENNADLKSALSDKEKWLNLKIVKKESEVTGTDWKSKYNSCLFEFNAMKKVLQQNEKERTEMRRKIEDLQTKHYCDSISNGNLSNERDKLRGDIERLMKSMMASAEDRLEINKMKQCVEKLKHEIKSSKYYIDEIRKVTEQKNEQVRQVVYYKAYGLQLEEMFKLFRERRSTSNYIDDIKDYHRKSENIIENIQDNILKKYEEERKANELLITQLHKQKVFVLKNGYTDKEIQTDNIIYEVTPKTEVIDID